MLLEQVFNLILGVFTKIGFDFQNDFPCIYFDQKYVLDANLVLIGSVVRTLDFLELIFKQTAFRLSLGLTAKLVNRLSEKVVHKYRSNLAPLFFSKAYK